MKFTQEQFDEKLETLLDDMSGAELLAIPGLYEVASEYLNNTVLTAIRAEQTDENEDP